MQVANEFEVNTQTRGDERIIIIIEYEVFRTEVNRYVFKTKEELK